MHPVNCCAPFLWLWGGSQQHSASNRMLGLGGRRQDLADTGEPGKKFQCWRKWRQYQIIKWKRPKHQPAVHLLYRPQHLGSWWSQPPACGVLLQAGQSHKWKDTRQPRYKLTANSDSTTIEHQATSALLLKPPTWRIPQEWLLHCRLLS